MSHYHPPRYDQARHSNQRLQRSVQTRPIAQAVPLRYPMTPMFAILGTLCAIVAANSIGAGL